ncbi:MAG TPA: bifunctional 5,10-methylenetetrahydrofolate dehydrogenase/5,10-methenyltetrahydrofolate cyclohydrolase, partial [Euryarchaeota archaeon]|nr:bifunctional 5,10-methylenetetrahydrofolate dehydrogenase/5,10-methenyltetrahydrofolate cyclohydrolase [Euryarchaeota archaeon]
VIAPLKLEVIIVGDDPASHSYVRSKERTASKIGILGETIHLEKTVDERLVLETISKLNKDPSVHGILVQLPLPDHISTANVQEAIHPNKDVDCFHPVNLGRLFRGDPVFIPATPGGIMAILKEYDVKTRGKNAVVIGRSDIVGKPMAHLLSSKGVDATVTLVHSRTKNIPEIVSRSDIVVAAVGIPHFVKGDWIKDGSVVIDVGINSIKDSSAKKGYTLTGDVDFSKAAERASLITPVPKGVGPMTIAGLMENVVRAKEMLT